jgi:hypothetical protein
MQTLAELRIGDTVRLNSGSPDAKVVSCDGPKITMEWSGESGPSRLTLPSPCVHRVSTGSLEQNPVG